MLTFALSQYQSGFGNTFESEAVPGKNALSSEYLLHKILTDLQGTIPKGQNSPRCVRFGLYAEQMTGSAFAAPRHLNKKVSGPIKSD
jgi:homogentisate 1,2-dioxygenase